MYPISMRLEGHRAAVVGGGRVAYRKIKRLVEEKASVLVLAPRIIPEIEALLAEGRVVWQQAEHDEFCWRSGAFRLVFAATDDRAANEEVCRRARAAGALVNSATAPEDCDFFVPAAVRQGDLELTASTGGGSPAFARLLRQDMERRYHAGFGEFAAWLGDVRQELQKAAGSARERQRLWRRIMQPELIELLLQRRLEQAKDEVRREISGAGAESSDSAGGDQGKIQRFTGKNHDGACQP